MADVQLPEGFTEEEVLWPRLTFWERVRYSWSKDSEFGRVYREAKWIGKRVLESCQACHLHSPREPRHLPNIRVFIPDGPEADPAYSFLVDLPPAVRTGRVSDSFVQDLTARLGGFHVELTINNTGVWLRVPCNKIPLKPPACTLEDMGPPPETYRLPLPLGVTQHGPLWADLDEAPHALFAGATGSGKSTLIHACLHYLIPRAEIWGIDLKRVELNRYRPQFAQLATNPADVAPLLNDLLRETNARLTQMEMRGDNLWRGRRLVLVVDELAEVTLASKQDTHMLLRMAQIGRAAGVHLLLATQRPSVHVIPGDLKANLPLRVAFALPTLVDSRVVLDQGGAEVLSPPGDALVLQGHKITRVSTPYFKPPPLSLDTDNSARLAGLSAEERAAYKAIREGRCSATVRGLKDHFHWGNKASSVLRALRAIGVLEDAGGEEAPPASEGVSAVPESVPETVPERAPDVFDVFDVSTPTENTPDGTHRNIETKKDCLRDRLDRTTDRATDRVTDSIGNGASSPGDDARAAREAIQTGTCKASVRGLKAHFRWGTDRARCALQAVNASVRPEDSAPVGFPGGSARGRRT